MAKSGYQENPLRNRLSKEQFHKLHHIQGISQTEIAKMLDVSMAYIIRLRKQYGIEVNKGVVRKPHVEVTPRISLEDQTSPDEINHLYHGGNLSTVDIGNKYGVTRKTVWKYMIRHGIEIRDKTQARRLGLKAGRIPQLHYDIDEYFFSIWTAQMAWVLGLMFTDGNMCAGPSGILQASLSSIDLSLLEKVRSAMHSTHPIKTQNQSLGGSIYRFTFCRRITNEALVNFGVTPKKSLTIKFPHIPRPYLSHFIRGIFDGDGSVFFEARSRKSPLRVFFVSGSRDFIEELEHKLNEQVGLSKQTIYSRPEGTSFYFKYAHADCINFFKYIYAGTDESMRMESKYQKFIEGFRNSGMSESFIEMNTLSLRSLSPPPPQPVLMPSISAIKDRQEDSVSSSKKMLSVNVNSIAVPKHEAGKLHRCRFKVTLNGVIVYAGWLVSNSDTNDSFIHCSRSCQIPSADVACVETSIKAGQNNIIIEDRDYQIEIRMNETSSTEKKNSKIHISLRNELQRITDEYSTPDKLSQQSYLIAKLKLQWPHNIVLLKDTRPLEGQRLSFTCYQYAFDLIDVAEVDRIAYTYPEIFPNSEFTSYLITELMREITIDNTKDGDIVVYFKNGIPTHAGKMKNNQVVSKWGIAHLWLHGVFEIPLEYGDSARFYSNPGKQAFIVAFQKWASVKIKKTSPEDDKNN